MAQSFLNFVILTGVKRTRDFGSPFTPAFGVNGQSGRVARKDLAFLFDGLSLCFDQRPAKFPELLLVPDFSAAEAAATLPIIFLGIVIWPALLSGIIRISKALAAPRAKETKYR